MSKEQTKSEKTPTQKETEEKIVYVGHKSLGTHLQICRVFLKETGKILVVARGRLISKAVYLAEILKKDGVKIQEITTATELMESFGGGKHSASVIRITLVKK